MFPFFAGSSPAHAPLSSSRSYPKGGFFAYGLGGALGLIGVFLTLALLSYGPGDPCWNVATSAVLTNWMGQPGANMSDLCLQLWGGGSFVLASGICLLSFQAMMVSWARLLLSAAALCLALASGCVLLSVWEAGGVWGAGILGAFGILRTWEGQVGLFSVCGISLLILLAPHQNILGRGGGRIWSLLKRTLGALKGMSERVVTNVSPSYPADGPASSSSRKEAETYRESGPTLTSTLPVSPPVISKIQPGSAVTPKPSAEYQLPPLELLSRSVGGSTKLPQSPKALEASRVALQQVLQDFGVRGQITGISPGPVVTLYELEPAAGLKSSRVIGLADDIARSMSAISARVAVVPGRNIIGIELPNPSREVVLLRELLEKLDTPNASGKLGLALGKDISGAPVVVDLTRMPHLLVAGTTGSGKSVGINAMILSLLYKMSPDMCKFIMIDPKMLELSVYDGIPHLLTPVVTEPKKAIIALKWAVREMENRYRSMSQLGVRNIEGYNERVALSLRQKEPVKRTVQVGFDDTGRPRFEEQPLTLTPLPFIVIVVDEMADLMLVAGKDIEAAVQRLAQMARAAGIHLIMATQRPSVDVITGTIKANFPTRMSFQVTSKIDSRTILGEQGAEQLLGQGDMLYMASGGRILRIHGPFVSDTEVERVVSFLKTQGEPSYVCDLLDGFDEPEGDNGWGLDDGDGQGEDKLYRQAVEVVLRHRKASTSFVQRQLQLGYNRAARLVERMENEGLVSAPNHVGKRDILTERE